MRSIRSQVGLFILAVFVVLLIAGAVIFVGYRDMITGAAVTAKKCSSPEIGGYCGCFDVHGDGTISWRGVGEGCPNDGEWEPGCPPGFDIVEGTDCAYDLVESNDQCCVYPEG